MTSGGRTIVKQLATEPEHPEIVRADPQQLADRVLRLHAPGERTIIGITGPPGTGKSTLVRQIVTALPPGLSAVMVPMDGFHLSNSVLSSLGLLHRKGAIETFDAYAYASLIERCRSRDEDTVYAPDFDHAVGEPIAASIGIPREAELVFTEGNYLLADPPPWRRARAAMTQVWYLETPDDLRIHRLISRHISAGKTAQAAEEWARGSDESNARKVSEMANKADLIIQNLEANGGSRSDSPA